MSAGGWVETPWFAALVVFVLPLTILAVVTVLVLLFERRDGRRVVLPAGPGPGRPGGEPSFVPEAPHSMLPADVAPPRSGRVGGLS